MNSWQYRYDTGWINRSDWTNVHLGSNTTKDTDSNVTHNLNAPLCNLLVKVFISTDGTDANSYEIPNTSTDAASTGRHGWRVSQVSLNELLIQTGAQGLMDLASDGIAAVLDSEDYYYKVKVWYLG